MPDIKVYPELNRAAIAYKQSETLRLWYLLHAHYRDGRVDLDDARTILAPYFTPQKFAANLRKGNGTYWRKGTSGAILYLCGLETLCHALRLIPFCESVLLPLSVFTSPLQFRAAAYASYFSSRPDAIYSRRSLSEKFNQSEATLRRWEKIAGVELVPNIARMEWPDEATAPTVPLHIEDRNAYQSFYECRYCGYHCRFRAHLIHHLAVHPFIKPVDRNDIARHSFLAWRLPNSFLSPYPTGGRSKVRTVRVRLKQRLSHVIRHKGDPTILFQSNVYRAEKSVLRYKLPCYHRSWASVRLSHSSLTMASVWGYILPVPILSTGYQT